LKDEMTKNENLAWTNERVVPTCL